MEKPKLYVVVSYDDNGRNTAIFFNRDEAIEEYDRTDVDGKVVGEVMEYNDFGQGAWGDWYGIDIIKESDDY